MLQKPTGSSALLFASLCVAGTTAVQSEIVGQNESEGAMIDLTRLANYADQDIPNYINRDNTPGDNAITDLGATLGRVLFYDKRLSRNSTVSCASCHKQEHAFSDVATASTGVSGTTGRHSMRLVNARFAAESQFFWDERAASLEIQTTQPIQDHVEMGFSGADGDPALAELVNRLSDIEEYQVLFTAVFGDGGVTEERMQDAMAQFVRSIQSFDSRFDEGRAAVGNNGAPFPNFTAEENAGKQLFLGPPGPGGGAGCAGCHRPPEFDIDPNSGHNGVTGSLSGGTDFTVTRSPSLRDLVDANGNPHGGFMHTAEFATLDAVIAHYNAIPGVTPGLDRRLAGPPPRPGDPPGQGQRLNLTAAQQASLVAFLETLTGSNIYTDPKWSDPFDEVGSLDLVILPPDVFEMSFAGGGMDRTVTLSMQAVANVDYVLQSSMDMDHWTSVVVTADATGMVSETLAAPVDEPACFYRFVYVPAP